MICKHLSHPFALAAFGVLGALAGGAAHAQGTFKVGVVTFLSGPAAESFGVPAANGAKLMVDQFNKGAAPAPFKFGSLL